MEALIARCVIRDGAEWFAYRVNGVDCIGIFPSRQLALAAFLSWME